MVLVGVRLFEKMVFDNNAYMRAWYARNRVKILAKQRAYRQRPEVKAKWHTYCLERKAVLDLAKRLKELEAIPESKRSVCQCERLKGLKAIKELNLVVPPEFFDAARQKECSRGS